MVPTVTKFTLAYQSPRSPARSIRWRSNRLRGPPLPRYGTRSLVELLPSLLSCLGIAGFANPLGVEAAGRVCLLGPRPSWTRSLESRSPPGSRRRRPPAWARWPHACRQAGTDWWLQVVDPGRATGAALGLPEL